MSDETLDATAIDTTEAGSSLADRIAACEAEIAQEPEVAIILPVPGKETFLSVQYRPLTYREAFKIETRHQKNKDEAEQFLFIAADKLIEACDQILEQTGPDEYKQTGQKWSVRAARELFRRTLPDSATARTALISMFPDEEAVIQHCKDYEDKRQELRKGLDSRLEGESAAGSTTKV